MRYKLKFFKSAYKEWHKLDPHIQQQFKQHLEKRIENPHVESSKLKGYPNLYKIKLRTVGYRLAYLMENSETLRFMGSVWAAGTKSMKS